MAQRLLDRYHLDRFRSSFLPALLIVALGVTGTVTFHAYKASKEHRAVVERVLANYVAFAASQFQEATQQAINSCSEYWLHFVFMTPDPTTEKVRLDVCNAEDASRFELNVNDRTAVSHTGLDDATVNWLLDTIPAHPTTQVVEGRFLGNLIATHKQKPALASYVLLFENGRPTRVIGLVSTAALAFIAAETPKTVTVTDNMPRERTLDYFSVEYGEAAKASQRPRPRQFTAQVTTTPEMGELPIVVGLQEAGLNVLAPGGLPRSRGWEFLGLFALAAGLVASSLLLLRREAELARTRANFVSGVSHELRTPLAQIRMFAEMLLLGRVRSESDRRRSLEIIDTEARRLSQLVENVLQVARAENGHIRVNPTTMSVAPIVRECVETFSVLEKARGIDFRMELQEDLVAPVDSAAIRQIVLNLLDNAAKYGPDGQRVVVGVALYDDTARIWVDDEGAGIPVRDRERVFDAFYRSRDVQHTTGSGIGLSVVRELVTLHGGSTWIEDAPDGGTRVVAQFPGAQLANLPQVAGDFAVA